jgi:hypothetical protein
MTLADRAQGNDSKSEKTRMVMGALSEPRTVETGWIWLRRRQWVDLTTRLAGLWRGDRGVRDKNQ